MKTHRDLEVWKQAIRLSKEVYEVTRTYPKEEMFGLTAQMRRAAISIASNIAEGAAREGDREFIRFLYIAAGSLSELDTQVTISREIGIADDARLATLKRSVHTVRKMMHGLIRSVKARDMKARRFRRSRLTVHGSPAK